MNSKKMRGKNFVDAEVMYLVHLVEKKKKIIENKRTNSATNDQKAAAWKLIEEQFNAMFPFNIRTADNLITKYDNMKQQAKKYAARRRQAELGAGDGPCMVEVNAIYEKLLEIITKKVGDGEKYEKDSDNKEGELVMSSCLRPIYEESNSGDVPLLLVDETSPIGKDHINHIGIYQTNTLGTDIDEIPDTTLREQENVVIDEESKVFVASTPFSNVNRCHTSTKRGPTTKNQAYTFFETKEKYYNLKIKYLEADIALKQQELKEKKEQEKLKLELLKLQVEEQRLLVLEKRRKLQLE